MEKKRVIKEDGRYLIFYSFERPLPQIHADQVLEEAEQAPLGGRGETSGSVPEPER